MLRHHLTFWPPILLSALAVWSFAIGPALRDLNATRANVETAKATITALEARIQALQSNEADIQIDPALIWKDEPGPMTTAAVQRRISDLAGESGLQLTSVYSEDAQAVGSYQRYRIRLEAETRLEELVPFLDALERSRPILRISQLQIRPVPRFDPGFQGTYVYANLTVWGLGAPEEGG